MHVIRLRGPWLLADGRRVKLPATWADAGGDAERLTLSRVFHRPPNLDDTAKVTLRATSAHQIERVEVDDVELADGAEITPLLDKNNRLTVALTRRDPSAEVLQAWLEIVE